MQLITNFTTFTTFTTSITIKAHHNQSPVIISIFIEITALMILFSRRNLHYSDYKWTAYVQNDPRVNGKPDDTLFNKEEGNEVVYLINKLMIFWDYRFANTGNKMEKLIHDKLPETITKQEEVQQWLKDNLKF